MKKLMTLAIILLTLLIAVPVSASPATLVVDDDGADCPDAAYTTIEDAVDAASGGETIAVCTGTYAGATVDKTVHIEARGNVVINDGPNSHSFLRAGFLFPGGGAGSGSTISGLRFEGTPQSGYVDDGHLDFPIFSRGADNVTIKNNVFNNSLQAITNWHGSGWTVQHNKIEGLWVLCGGGIGILIGDRQATEEGVKDNVVSHNEITGILHVDSGDCGGYAGTGIVLYADFRWGQLGAEEIANNRVVKNKISLTSDTPDVVDVVAIELTDTRDDDELDPVIFDNAIGFNDLRGTDNAIALTPESLADENDISRNLGDNRGHGSHPSVFGPGD